MARDGSIRMSDSDDKADVDSDRSPGDKDEAEAVKTAEQSDADEATDAVDHDADVDVTEGAEEPADTVHDTGTASPLFRRLHPIGWAAGILAVLAVIATVAGWDLLIGRMPWWLWAIILAAIALAAAPNALHMLRQVIERVSTTTGYIAFVLAWLVFFIQVFNVVTRYSNDWFDADILFGQAVSMAWMGFGLLFLLGANYGVKAAVNPRVDFWWADWSNRRKAWLDFIMHTLFFFPFLILGIRVLLPYAKISLGFRPFANDGQGEWPAGWRVWETWEQSVNAGELPVGPIQAFLLVGFVLWAAQVFAEMIKTGFVIAGRDELADIASTDAPLRVE